MTNSVVLHLGDCMDFMRSMPDECVDAVVTDPPYGIGFMYKDGREKTNTPADYWKWYQPFHAEYMRMLRPGGFWAVWQSGTYHRYLWDWFGDNTRIYIAAKNFVQIRQTAINYAYDPVAMGYKDGEQLRPQHPPRSFDYSVANTGGTVSDPNRLEKAHPNPRPLGQVKHIIENFTLPGGIVFDPFMGSGTSGVACALLGRDFVGCEINKDYFSLAKLRIEQSTQPMLLNMEI